MGGSLGVASGRAASGAIFSSSPAEAVAVVLSGDDASGVGPTGAVPVSGQQGSPPGSQRHRAS